MGTTTWETMRQEIVRPFGLVTGTTSSSLAANTSLVDEDLEDLYSADDYFNGNWFVIVTSNNNINEYRRIVDYDGSAISGVFDDVPEQTSYPYVVIGEETATEAGTKDVDAHEHTLTIHVWSQYRGLQDIKKIMQQIYTQLHNTAITVSGANLVNIRHEFENTLLEQDGITRHGIMRFRAVVFD